MATSVQTAHYMIRGQVRRQARVIPGVLALAGALTAIACSSAPTVPDLNLPSVNDFASTPTLGVANTLAIGILRGVRDNAMNALEILGPTAREGYGICTSCGALTGQIKLPINSSSYFIEFQMYPGQYTDLSEARLIQKGLPKIQGITAQQAAAMAGFVQTMEAIDITNLIFTRDTFGLVIYPNTDPTGTPGPVVSRAAAYTYLLSLFDSAYANLQAGGSAFTFALPPGFSSFNTPATFATLNRALRARVDIHTSNYTQALADLAVSFLSTAAPLSAGASFDFSSSSGDEPTDLFKSYYRAETHYLDSAQLQPGGAPDLRWTNKVTLTTPLSYIGVTSPYLFTAQLSAASPLPLIRNEELILMRAEAQIALGNTAGALPDINLVRQTSGGLAPLTIGDIPTQAAALSELLYEKKYSLWWEGGQRWYDLKHYGLFANLPGVIPGGRIYDIFPIPISDCNAYPTSQQPAGCTTVVGILGVSGGGGG